MANLHVDMSDNANSWKPEARPGAKEKGSSSDQQAAMKWWMLATQQMHIKQFKK